MADYRDPEVLVNTDWVAALLTQPDLPIAGRQESARPALKADLAGPGAEAQSSST